MASAVTRCYARRIFASCHPNSSVTFDLCDRIHDDMLMKEVYAAASQAHMLSVVTTAHRTVSAHWPVATALRVDLRAS